MGRNIELTNLTASPRGFHELGAVKPTILGRGESTDGPVTVSDHTFSILAKDAEREPRPIWDLTDHGSTGVDHDGDKRMGGSIAAGTKLATGERGEEVHLTLTADLKAVQAIADEAQKALAEAQVEINRLNSEVDRLTEELDTANKALQAAGSAQNGGGASGATETNPAPVDPRAGDNPGKPAEYAPSQNFDKLEDAALRAFLDAEPAVEYHKLTGHAKLVDKALAKDRAAWDAAQAALSKVVTEEAAEAV